MNDVNSAFEVEDGFKLEDGPFITGGASSPIGLGLPIETIYFQNTVGGIKQWVKISTGDTSADWKFGVPSDELDHRGWESISDTTFTQGSPFTAIKNSRTLIPINSDSVVNSQIPDGITTFWNDATSTFEPNRSGDFYFLRLNFTTNASKNFSNAEVELDIGGTQGVVWSDNIQYDKGAGTDTNISFSIPVFTLNTFVTNGGKFYITGSNNLEIYSQSIVIFRTFRGRQ